MESELCGFHARVVAPNSFPHHSRIHGSFHLQGQGVLDSLASFTFELYLYFQGYHLIRSDPG